jgi:hypothetical protein
MYCSIVLAECFAAKSDEQAKDEYLFHRENVLVKLFPFSIRKN